MINHRGVAFIKLLVVSVAELLPGNALLCERIKHSSAPGRVGEGGLHTSIVVVEDGCGAVLEPGLFLREDF